MILIRMTIKLSVILKMDEIDQTKFRLDEIKKIENYFNSEINHAVKN